MENSEKTQRSRYLCGISYLSEQEIQEVLSKHHSSIVAFAYILHDKDLDSEGNIKEPHYHIVIRTYSAWSPLQLRKWFKGYFETKDGEEKEKNTLMQIVINKDSIIQYLTHSNEDDDSQYKYPQSDIVDGGIEKIVPRTDSEDDTIEIIDSLIYGESIRELVKRYGKKFVYHYAQYKFVADMIKEEDNQKPW